MTSNRRDSSHHPIEIESTRDPSSSSTKTKNASAEAGQAFQDYLNGSGSGETVRAGPGSTSEDHGVTSYHQDANYRAHPVPTGTSTSSSSRRYSTRGGSPPAPPFTKFPLVDRTVSNGSATGALPLSKLLSAGGGSVTAAAGNPANGSEVDRDEAGESRRRSLAGGGYSYSNLARNAYDHPHPSSSSSRRSPLDHGSDRRHHQQHAYEDERSYARDHRTISPGGYSHRHAGATDSGHHTTAVRPFLASPAESLGRYPGGYGSGEYARGDESHHYNGQSHSRYHQHHHQDEPSSSSLIRGHREYEYEQERASRRESESKTFFGPMPTGRSSGRPLPPASQGSANGSGHEYEHHSRGDDREHRSARRSGATNGHPERSHWDRSTRDELVQAKRARLAELVQIEARRRVSPGVSLPVGERAFYGYKRERGRSTASPGGLDRTSVAAADDRRVVEDDMPRFARGTSNGTLASMPGLLAPISRPQSRTGSSHEPTRLPSFTPEPREEYRSLTGHRVEHVLHHNDRSISPSLPASLPIPPTSTLSQLISNGINGVHGAHEEGQLAAPAPARRVRGKGLKSKSKGKTSLIPPPADEDVVPKSEIDVDDELRHLIPADDSMMGEEDSMLIEGEADDDLLDGSKRGKRQKKEVVKEMSPETKQRWERESWPTKGLVNKDGSLRRKPGPPKGITKAKKPSARKADVGLDGDDDIRQQALRNASGMGEAEGSGQEDGVDEDGNVLAVDTPPKKKKRAKKSIASLPASRASSPAPDLASEADSQYAAEVDHDLEDMLDAPRPSKTKRKGGRDGGLFNLINQTPIPQRDAHFNPDDPFYGDEDNDHAGVADEEGAGQSEAEVEPEPEPEPEPPIVISMSEFLACDKPDAELTERVARARYMKADLMRASIWKDIVSNQIGPVHKYLDIAIANKLENARKVSGIAVRQQKRWVQRPYATPKEVQARARKAARDAAAYWKKNEKEEIEQRKRAEREAIEKAKADEAAREKARAAKRLQFLLDSGETYSKLMLKKIKTDDAMDHTTTAVEQENAEAPADEDMDLDEDFDEADIEMNEDDHDPDMSDEVAKQRAAARARAIMGKKRREAAAFDQQVQAERQAALAAKGNINEQLTSESLDFQNPLGAGVRSTVTQPKMLQAQLKEYQVKGLSWLAHLYENGINGILADEMGLGKTIQSISLLAWLAETQNIWGPFLVVAPTSTVHNWQQELTRFVPKLKAIPYWGKPTDRQVLRRDWNRKSIVYTEDAPFHLVVTSYDMAVQDHAYFQKVRWQYMILDEAQAVKNSSSLRWTTLLSLKTRNRLLLTGTPIQNSMTELWALLHFIMPDLFTSLNDFTEWFSKGIEGVAGQGDSTLGTQQLRRLHDVLRPFMLRRIKKNVQSELGDKIEKDILVDLSSRQKAMYRMLRSDASIKAFLAQASAGSDSAAKTNVLLNIVMQFRKVCNHPDLFQRPDVVSPLSFGTFSGSGELIRQKELYCPDSCRNPIEYAVPKLVWEDGGILSRPGENSVAGFDTKYLHNLFNIWSPANAPLPTAGYRPNKRTIFEDPSEQELPSYYQRYRISTAKRQPFDARRLIDVADIVHETSWLTRKEARFVIDDAIAPPIHATCRSRSFIAERERLRLSETERLSLFGLPRVMADDQKVLERARRNVPNLPALGLLGTSPTQQLPLPSMAFPNAKRLMVDSAKLLRMDQLLRELKEGGHRVLVYFQMTKMMDLFEEYLSYRQYRYVRLDGSTQLGERRDMVNAYQTNPDIFIFMLSTRAGGLGINLTAADTVVFYEHDWNPSNDSQAMDRAHRVGQTRQVTVYRLICKGTVEERMLHLARNKKDVQDIVVGNKSVAEVNSGKEIVSMLLDDEDDSGALAGGFSRAHGMVTDVGNPLMGGGDGDDDNFFGNAVKKPSATAAATGDADGAKPVKKRRKTAAAVVAEDGEGEASGTTPGAEVKPKRVRKKKVEGDEGEGGEDGDKPKVKRRRKTKAPTDLVEAEASTGTGTGTPAEVAEIGTVEDMPEADALIEDVL